MSLLPKLFQIVPLLFLGGSLRSVAGTLPHYFLVHGGGPEFIVSMKAFARRLEAKGVARQRIHLLRYTYSDSLSDINNELILQFRSELGPQVRGVVITHSLGDFVALRALLESERSEYVDTFIALAGVAHGQDQAPRFCGKECPEYFTKLTPSRNPFVEGIWEKYAVPLSRLSHCALYSLSDRRVTQPRDAAVFPHSRVGVLDEISHIEFIHDSSVLDAIEATCALWVR